MTTFLRRWNKARRLFHKLLGSISGGIELIFQPLEPTLFTATAIEKVGHFLHSAFWNGRLPVEILNGGKSLPDVAL